MISRRLFLTLTGTAILAPRVFGATDEIPSSLDHILLGCNDLDRGVAYVEEHTAVRAAIGGVHPDEGTRNALLSLGERRYLEIIAPDPRQDSVQPYALQRLSLLKQLNVPHLIGWAAHPGRVDELARKLRAAGIAAQDVRPGSRKRPDGRTLNWKTLNLIDDHRGLLPFFIEWSPDSVHPSVDAPAGCRVEGFGVADPQPKELSSIYQRLGIKVKTERGESPQLRVRLVGPKGRFEITS
jgi:hypothetical protein